jgi:hypothetical protein
VEWYNLEEGGARSGCSIYFGCFVWLMLQPMLVLLLVLLLVSVVGWFAFSIVRIFWCLADAFACFLIN